MARGSIGDSERNHAMRFGSSVVGRRLNSEDIGESVCRDIFLAISRQEEVANTVRDQWGCWDWQYSDAQRRGELFVPWLDRPLAEIRKSSTLQDPTLRLEPLWPEDRPFALCLSHDVDVVSERPNLNTAMRVVRNSIRNKQGGLAIKEVIERATDKFLVKNNKATAATPRHFEDWLELEDRLGFRSTFFFFPSQLSHPHRYDCTYQFDDVVKYAREQIKTSEMIGKIDQAGWEIGLHGSFYSAIESGLLDNQKNQIEDALGHEILSTRQHWLNYNVSITPCLQAEAGLKVDSTLGFNRSIGFRAGTAFPFWTWDQQATQPLPVLEIPQHIMDAALFTENALEYDEDMAIQHSLQLVDAVEQVGGCLTLNWHTNHINDTKWWNVYRSILEECALRRAWGCSAGQLYEWWTAREQRILSPRHDQG